MTTTDEAGILSRALDQTGDLLDRVHAETVTRPTPCEQWDVGALADHVIADATRFVTMLRGGEADWGAPAPHVSESWGPTFKVGADDVLHAWDQGPGATRREGGAAVPVGLLVAEYATHSWDLAKALGVPSSELDPEVAEVALDFMTATLKPEMRMDAFDPEVAAPEGAGPYELLAAFAGRRLA
ncbi:TIGR03086 family metal-binding protein [Nocardioides sp. NPDC051685]|uniref:TIGR03086 family metal-binding protein n=1 Tax=Nocardioides sp. NPDC051685 TaxID=3364334 RepID=UPI0037A10CCB